MKRNSNEIDERPVFTIRKMKIDDQKVLTHWNKILSKIKPVEEKENKN